MQLLYRYVNLLISLGKTTINVVYLHRKYLFWNLLWDVFYNI